MGHDFYPLRAGLGGLPCALCGRSEAAHAAARPVAPDARLDHNELVRRLGRCDGRCGTHGGANLSHNELIRLHGRCPGGCGAGH